MRAKKSLPQQLSSACQDLANTTGHHVILIAGPISDELCEDIYSLLRTPKPKKIDVVLHSYGGFAEPAFFIAKTIRERSDYARAIVPRMAKSAATLICLGMEEIVLGDLGELGPIDAQVSEKSDGDVPEHKSALNRFKALENIQEFVAECFHLGASAIAPSRMKASEVAHRASEFASSVAEPLLRQLSPQRIGEARRALEEGMAYGDRLLQRYVQSNSKTANQITKRLAFYYPSHGFVLDAQELREIGLNARSATPEEDPLIEALRGQLKPMDSLEHPISGMFSPVSPESSSGGDGVDDSLAAANNLGQTGSTLEAKPGSEAPESRPKKGASQNAVETGQKSSV